jgi:hypothetical protein
MKRIGLLITGCMLSLASFGQTNATDASPVDCNGVTHNLFTDLDAGKIIVIGWTMPCATCAAPLLEVHNAVLNYLPTNPGVVEYWLTDDFANTNCSSIQGWAATNGINNAIFFSSAELDMFDYGTTGMPKVVVVGCSDHKVYYNRNDNPTGAGVTGGVDQALLDIASACALGQKDLENAKFGLECFPNPASSKLNVTFTHESSDNLMIEVYNISVALFKTMALEKSNSKKQEIQVNVEELIPGLYFLKLVDETSSEVVKIQIVR